MHRSIDGCKTKVNALRQAHGLLISGKFSAFAENLNHWKKKFSSFYQLIDAHMCFHCDFLILFAETKEILKREAALLKLRQRLLWFCFSFCLVLFSIFLIRIETSETTIDHISRTFPFTTHIEMEKKNKNFFIVFIIFFSFTVCCYWSENF